MEHSSEIINLNRCAKLALNNYTRMLDAKLGYIPYFYAFFKESGAYAHHCEWDFGDATGRYLDALISCGKMTGVDTNEASGRLKKALEQMFSEGDGLCYRPAGFSWVHFGANMFDQRSALLGLLSWYLETGETKPYELIKGIISGLKKTGVFAEDYFYLPFTDYVPGMKVDRVPFERSTCEADPCHYGGGVIILPLALFYEKTGDSDTFELLKGLTNFIIHRSGVFKEDGSFWAENHGDCDGHFHSRMGTVAGILRFGICTGDGELISWCRKVYEWACTQGTTNGLFPEGLGSKVQNGLAEEYPEVARHSEICCTTDMIHIALYLSKCGAADYWDHAERYFNHLYASQLKDISWVKEAEGKEDTELYTFDRVPQRYLGAFTGRTTANDLTNNGNYDTMGCCVAAGGRGLFLLWSNAADLKGNDLYVHLWVGCELEEADISCLIPEKDELCIVTKVSCNLHIRIPDWFDAITGPIRLTVDGKVHRYEIIDGYLNAGECQPGSFVKLSSRLEALIKTEKFCGEEYRVRWKGNRVTGVEPAGRFIPLYPSLTGTAGPAE